MGVSPVEVREVVYQSVAYLGIGRVFPFLRVMNEVFEARGISIPLPPQSTTTTETRREAGTHAQVDIFGEHMRNYTRTGLTHAQREMLTSHATTKHFSSR